MEKKSFLHHYKGFGIHESDCFVHVFNDHGDYLILFEDIDAGVSVTNSSEQLATEITNEYNLDPVDCRFFETYRQYGHDTFDEVSYTWKNGKASNATWHPSPHEKNIFMK